MDFGRVATLDVRERDALDAWPWLPGFPAVVRTAPERACGLPAFAARPVEAAPLLDRPTWPPEPVRLPRFPREDDEPPPEPELRHVACAAEGVPVAREPVEELVAPLLRDEPECDPPGVDLTGGSETLGVLTRGVVTAPTVIDGVVTEGVLTEGTETVGTETMGTETVGIETVGTVTAGTEIVGPAAIAAAAAVAQTSEVTETTRTRNRIWLMAASH